MEIRRDDLSSAATRELLRLHLAGMHANSPPGHVFASGSGLAGAGCYGMERLEGRNSLRNWAR